MDYQEIITVEPDKRGGQPCIRGLRITVYDVLSYLASGMTEEEIISDYPDLTHEDILASLSYAADRERKTAVSHARNCSSITTSPTSSSPDWRMSFPTARRRVF